MALQALYSFSVDQADSRFRVGCRSSTSSAWCFVTGPYAQTIWLFRERLAKARAISTLFERFDVILREPGYIIISGQVFDFNLIDAPKQRNTKEEKDDIRAGQVQVTWNDKPAKLQQKDRDAL
jgi:hypothetical protein